MMIKFNFIPRLVNRSWPDNLKPLDLGFEARPNWPAKIRGKDNLETVLGWSVC